MDLDPQRGIRDLQSQSQHRPAARGVPYRVGDQFGDQQDRRLLQMSHPPRGQYLAGGLPRLPGGRSGRVQGQLPCAARAHRLAGIACVAGCSQPARHYLIASVSLSAGRSGTSTAETGTALCPSGVGASRMRGPASRITRNFPVFPRAYDRDYCLRTWRMPQGKLRSRCQLSGYQLKPRNRAVSDFTIASHGSAKACQPHRRRPERAPVPRPGTGPAGSAWPRARRAAPGSSPEPDRTARRAARSPAGTPPLRRRR